MKRFTAHLTGYLVLVSSLVCFGTSVGYLYTDDLKRAVLFFGMSVLGVITAFLWRLALKSGEIV